MSTKIKVAELIAKLDLFKNRSSKANMGKAFGYGLRGRDYDAGYIFELALDFIEPNSYSLRIEVFSVEDCSLLKSDYLNLTTAKANKVIDWLKSNYDWIW